MGYIYLMTVALLFSFGGTCVKMIKPYFDPSMITFLRFFVGVLWLLLLKTVKRQPFRSGFLPSLRLHWKWLVFGALSKFLAYMAENTALSVGVSYGNILVQPVQVDIHHRLCGLHGRNDVLHVPPLQDEGFIGQSAEQGEVGVQLI